MSRDRKGVSLGTLMALLLTGAVIIGCVVFFTAFKSDANVAMSAQKMAGLIEEAIQNRDEQDPLATVRTVTVTLAPVLHTDPPAAETPRPAAQLHSVSLTVGGLLAFQSDISDSVYDKAAADCDYTAVLSALAPHLRGDLNTVVFPQMLGAEKRNYSDLKVSSSAAQAMCAAGIHAVLLHTGAALEQGVQSALDTAAAFGRQGMLVCGVNGADSAQHARMEINGLRIALFCYTCAASDSVKSMLQSAAGQGLMRVYAAETAKREIQKARDEGTDAVIVFIHWGKPGLDAPTGEMREIARALADAGADVILGTGPKRLLPLERIQAAGKNGEGRQAIAVYSLGTLLSESREAQDIAGALLHIRIDGAGNGLCAVSLSYTPTYIWRHSVSGKTQYRVLVSDEAAPGDMNEKQKEIMGRALERVKSVWDTEIMR